MTPSHRSVLLREAVELLNVKKGGTYADATLGLGGHSSEILKNLSGTGRLIGIDTDAANLAEASRLLAGNANFTAIKGNFRDIGLILEDAGVKQIDGILFDLGVSSVHFDDASRGFSFSKEAPLDMRLDREAKLDAAYVVNNYREEDLARVIKEYGEERFFRRVASAIVRARPVTTTTRLAEVVASAIRGHQNIHPATRTFQALRIEVNGELDALRQGLKQALEKLAPGGRLAVISFHSLEDRIVKRFFNEESKECICEDKRAACNCNHKKKLEVLTKKPVEAGAQEARENPRARSAKLRCAERL